MSRIRFNTKAMNEACKAKTNALIVGGIYFLSSFYDKEGATVRVISKSTAKNTAGWSSSVSIEIIEPIGIQSSDRLYYAVGSIHTVNASNLYAKREMAAHRSNF